MILYNKLFEYMKEKNISKSDLSNAIGMSSATMAKLSKNETVSLQVIYNICVFLGCQPGDIMEIVGDIQENSLLYILMQEKEHRIKGGIYHQTQIQMAYNSNHIEGSTLSEDQTRAIYETNTIGLEGSVSKVDDIIETVNHFRMFDYMLSSSMEPLSQEIIKKFHFILKNGTSDSHIEWFAVGDYKKRPNQVSGQETTEPEKVEREMKKLLDWYNKCNKDFNNILKFHVLFEKIHPFQDGNGRVGRLIMFRECLKNNIVPFIVYDSEKLYYYRGIKEYDNESGYLRDTCLSFQDQYINMMKYFRIKV